MIKNAVYDSKTHTFLKAEVFCAAMLQQGISFNDIRLFCNSNFKRSFRNEIDEVKIEFNESTFKDELLITINKDGIYDRLPEGLFHQSKGNSKTNSTGQMAEEHRRFKEEEKAARNFFQPIEQEIFRYATFVEQEEVNLAFGILNGDIKTELLNFWGIPPGLPKEPVKRLMQLMPWVKTIKGNAKQTAGALEYVLEKPVTLTVKENNHHSVSTTGNKDYFFTLGIDAVTGCCFSEPSGCWQFGIGNIQKKEAENYRPAGDMGKLLKQFEEIFIPLQIDIIFDWDIADTGNFETDAILGISLSI